MDSQPLPSDLGTMTAAARPLVVDGRTYMLHPLTLSDFGQLQVWVDSQFPDPIALVNEAIRAGEFNAVQQQFLYKTALEIAARGHRPIGTPEADAMIRSVHGTKRILLMSISKGDPAFSAADVEALYAKLTIGDLARVYSATEAERVLADPKA